MIKNKRAGLKLLNILTILLFIYIGSTSVKCLSKIKLIIQIILLTSITDMT